MNTSARNEVFAAVRRSLGVKGSEATRRQIIDERLERAPRGIIPERGQGNAAEQVATFRRQAELAMATVAEVSSPAEVPSAVAAYLRSHNLPATLRMGSDPRLSAMPWAETALDISQGRSAGSDLNAISHAFGGVAETGTLALVSGAENPSSLNFLPDNHIVVVQAADIRGEYEGIWARVREKYGKAGMPRTVNFITGPSRSADIEQTLLLGAHGPRRLHIVLVRDGTGHGSGR